MIVSLYITPPSTRFCGPFSAASAAPLLLHTPRFLAPNLKLIMSSIYGVFVVLLIPILLGCGDGSPQISAVSSSSSLGNLIHLRDALARPHRILGGSGRKCAKTSGPIGCFTPQSTHPKRRAAWAWFLFVPPKSFMSATTWESISLNQDHHGFTYIDVHPLHLSLYIGKKSRVC